jgi:hypothetical protein
MANNYRILRSWNYIWERMANVITGGNSGTLPSPFGASPLVIDEALTLYVSTTGDTVGTGTVGQPFATVQQAIDYLKQFEIAGPVTVSVGPGTFPSFLVEGLRFSDGGFLDIVGSTTVLYSGVMTSITPRKAASTITDSSATFTTDQYSTYFLRALTPSSTSSGEDLRVIVSNTANTIDITGISLAASGSYQILRLDTIILGTGSVPIAVRIGSVSGGLVTGTAQTIGTSAGFRFRLNLLDLQTTTSSGRCLSAADAVFAANACKMSGVSAGTVVPTVIGTSISMFSACYIESSGTGTGAVLSNFGNNGGAIWTNIRNCYLAKKINLVGIGISISGGLNVNGTCIEGCTTGMSVNRSTNINTSVTAWFKNCGTGLSVGGKTLALVESSHGTGTAISVTGGGLVIASGCDLTATTGVSCITGGMCQVLSTTTITATTELSVDGVTSTLATMRATSPKIFPLTPNPYGSYIYE